MNTIELTHTIDAAHRVVGHTAPNGLPGKCSRLHGHTYTFKVGVSAEVLEYPGFVVDFAVIKAVLNEWDHRTLLWVNDPFLITTEADRDNLRSEVRDDISGVLRLPYNPTSENMAADIVARLMALDERFSFATVEVSETPTSRAFASLNRYDLDRLAQANAEAVRAVA